ncbi:sugar ABC transporter permease [Agromyces aerolatus]|uniref:sugar ABC transporter permease n=1 Tax=Agromyces sp. LY-1074 TaxID=3074080 RepID=UPI00286157F5|nr:MULTISPECIES: ABC transporter permease [unclassified Agromyces]MDR5701491.1 ABC transporter permease [Agromyces sp. LY-1074]MDR5704442.1 ABC transporter permease [Agromyces sp. LY-1358]
MTRVDEGPVTRQTDLLPASEQRTLRSSVQAYVGRLRAGDVGMLPVVVGLLLIAVVFQVLNANFLTANNLVNLLVQGSVYILIAIGTVYVLMIAEVDLSVGFVAGIAGVVTANLLSTAAVNVWVACALGIGAAALCGLVQGLVITALNLPSFVVTLGGQLAFMGVMLIILGDGGTLPINNPEFLSLANGVLPTTVGWILMTLFVAAFAASSLLKRRRLQAANRPVPALALLIAHIAVIAVFGTALMLLFSIDRGRVTSVTGVPVVILIVGAVLVLGTFLLDRTRFGRYVRAVGGGPEAARRAGIAVKRIRLYVFVLSGVAAGIGGLVLASRLHSVSTNLQGGQLVLYCIAAAVIGGTSMFGGRGKVIHALLGGLVIAGIDNGMGLLGLPAAVKFVVTGLVLLLAVSIDAIARRNRTAAGLA